VQCGIRTSRLAASHRRHASHLATFFAALLAHLGAALTMFVRMPFTFIRASIADVGADATDFIYEARPTADGGRARPAKVGAVNAQLRALRPVLLSDALAAAMFTFLSTPDASIGTRFVLLVKHGTPPFP
jgi:hypothetical protein